MIAISYAGVSLRVKLMTEESTVRAGVRPANVRAHFAGDDVGCGACGRACGARPRPSPPRARRCRAGVGTRRESPRSPAPTRRALQAKFHMCSLYYHHFGLIGYETYADGVGAVRSRGGGRGAKAPCLQFEDARSGQNVVAGARLQMKWHDGSRYLVTMIGTAATPDDMQVRAPLKAVRVTYFADAARHGGSILRTPSTIEAVAPLVL